MQIPALAPRTHRTALVLTAATTGVLLVLRVVQLLSAAAFLYDPEWTSMADLMLDLEHGTLRARNVGQFWHYYHYMTFAPGTCLMEVAGAVFAIALGPNSYALQAATVAAELFGVGFLAYMFARMAPLPLAALATLPFLFPPQAVLAFQLSPFGNHTEFLWIPFALGSFLWLRDPASRSRLAWAGPAILVGMGILLYALNVLAVVAFSVAVLLSGRRRTTLRGLTAVTIGGLLGAAGWVLVLQASGVDDGTSSPAWLEPAWLSSGARSAGGVGASLGRGLLTSLPVAGPGTVFGHLYRVLLLLGLLGAASTALFSRGPAALFARYVSLWAILAIGVPIVMGYPHDRYLISGVYGCLLCSTVTFLSARSARSQCLTAGVVVLLGILGLADGVRWIRPAVWSDTVQLDGLALFHDLSVVALDHDEIPYYNRIIDEGRASKWVGRPSGTTSENCRTERGQWSLGVHPRRDMCKGLSADAVKWMVETEIPASEGEVEGEEIRQVAMGRGLWIRCNRDMDLVERAVGLLSPDVAARILFGAMDEARRYEAAPSLSFSEE